VTRTEHPARPFVEDMFTAFFQNDVDRWSRALALLAGLNLVNLCASYGARICVAALVDIHNGQPSPEQVTDVARHLVDNDCLYPATTTQVERVLNQLLVREPLNDSIPRNALGSLLAVAAALIACSGNRRRYRHWHEYLDALEDLAGVSERTAGPDGVTPSSAWEPSSNSPGPAVFLTGQESREP
jgi:hypothetical protein